MNHQLEETIQSQLEESEALRRQIVHGIGEMLQAIDLFGLTKIPTIVDCCSFIRKNHDEVLNVRFNQLYQSLDGKPQPRRGRVEVSVEVWKKETPTMLSYSRRVLATQYLPVEWHESFTIHSQRRLLASEAPDSPGSSNFTITDVSLRTIPQLRQFANDTLLDVLYFMSPEHHDIIIDIVVKEMNFVVEKFRTLTGFAGDISLVGHSLGSIITWDILDNQRNASLPTQPNMQPRVEEEESPEVLGTSNKSETAPTGDGCTGPESSPEREENHRKSSAYPQLSFNVDNAFMLGSPLAVFLMIRNQRKPLSADFTLSGCSRVFNIFHPYDPVAYRIEPLLDPRNADVEPKIMTHCE
jgi:hypothetical protein